MSNEEDFNPSDYVDPTEPSAMPVTLADMLEVAEFPTSTVNVPEGAASLAAELLEAYRRDTTGNKELARAIWAVAGSMFIRVPGEDPRPAPLTRGGKTEDDDEREKARFVMRHSQVAVGDLAIVDDCVDSTLEIVRLIAEDNVDIQ